jgi:catechol 2,3-dioxygenase-like lactoylglutathione lyase family enzyme
MTMKNKHFLRGMATVSYWADDLKAARDWYTELFGIEAYYQMPNTENPAYIEFRIGDNEDEFGLSTVNTHRKPCSRGQVVRYSYGM